MKQKQAERRKYHYIYKITRIDGSWKYYIGMHSTDDLEDGYFGSGKRLWYSINKYGKEQHKKEILEFLPSRKELKAREKELVNKTILRDPLCMNIVVGGDGGFPPGATQKGIESLRKKRLDLEFDKTFRDKISKKHKLSYASGNREVSGCFSGELLKEMIKRANTPAINARRSEIMKIKQKGELNSQYGVKRAWVYKNDVKLKILRSDLEKYLSDGWQRGMKGKVVSSKGPKKSRQKTRFTLSCITCSTIFDCSNRDMKRGRKYCSFACFNKRNTV